MGEYVASKPKSAATVELMLSTAIARTLIDLSKRAKYLVPICYYLTQTSTEVTETNEIP